MFIGCQTLSASDITISQIVIFEIMKKIVGSLLLLGFVSFTSCKESLPPIDFAETEPFITETYVLGSVSQPPQEKHVLIEDLTGVRCPNCPAAAERASEIKNANPNRVHIVAHYTKQPVNLTFPFPNEDKTTDEATLIYTNIFGSPALPGGGVNRRPLTGETNLNQVHNHWASSANVILKETSNVVVEPQITQVDDSTLFLQSTFTFLEELEGNTFVSIMLLEDDIEGSQLTDTGDNHHYIHEHVLRKMYTPYNGTILFSNAEKGRVLKGEWNLEIPKNVNIEHASVLLIVNRNDAENKEVIQVMGVKP